VIRSVTCQYLNMFLLFYDSAELWPNVCEFVLLGMWAHYMTVEDYQDLIDRGWRR